MLLLHELDAVENRTKVGPCERRIGNIDDLHLALGVDHEQSGLGERPIRLLWRPRLRKYKGPESASVLGIARSRPETATSAPSLRLPPFPWCRPTPRRQKSGLSFCCNGIS